MQDGLSKVKKSYKQLVNLHDKLENNVKSMGDELKRLKKEIDKNSSESDNQISEGIIFEDDKELNDFLNEDVICKAINNYNEAYKNERINGYKPLVIMLVASIIVLIVYLNIKKFFKIEGILASVVIILVLLVSYGISVYLSKKIKNDISKNKIISVTNELSNKVQEVLKRGKYNSEYLSYVLLERMQERKRLNKQFSQIMRIISTVVKFSSFLAAIFLAIITAYNDSSGITILLVVIIFVICLGVLADYYNYKISDAYYYQRRTILDAVMKYKFENTIKGWKVKIKPQE